MKLRLFVLSAVVLGCAPDTVSPDDSPMIRGVITSRVPSVRGVRDANGSRLDSIPQILVAEPIEPGFEDPCQRSLYFIFGPGTPIARRSGAPADTGALVIGQEVSVWGADLVLASCPGQTGAVRIVIEDVP